MWAHMAPQRPQRTWIRAGIPGNPYALPRPSCAPNLSDEPLMHAPAPRPSQSSRPPRPRPSPSPTVLMHTPPPIRPSKSLKKAIPDPSPEFLMQRATAKIIPQPKPMGSTLEAQQPDLVSSVVDVGAMRKRLHRIREKDMVKKWLELRCREQDCRVPPDSPHGHDGHEAQDEHEERIKMTQQILKRYLQGHHVEAPVQRSGKRGRSPQPQELPDPDETRCATDDGKRVPHTMEVRRLRFSQKSCKSHFQCGRSIWGLVQDLMKKNVTLAAPFLRLTCFEATDPKTKKPIIKCKDNRRLLALKEYAKKSGKDPLMVNINLFSKETLSEVRRIWKNSDYTDGRSCKLRTGSGHRNKWNRIHDFWSDFFGLFGFLEWLFLIAKRSWPWGCSGIGKFKSHVEFSCKTMLLDALMCLVCAILLVCAGSETLFLDVQPMQVLCRHTHTHTHIYIYIHVHFTVPQENGGSSTEPVDNKEVQGVGNADGLRQIYKDIYLFIFIYLYIYMYEKSLCLNM